ncbi:MAG: PD40 domain-containing protein [Planctomycetes bacterium]|nr:PD40 domain-containing protein [Planctomycetota bacterium]
MKDNNQTKRFHSTGRTVLAILALFLGTTEKAVCADHRPSGWPNLRKAPWPKSELNLKQIPFKIVYETLRTTHGKENWELYLVHADGSNSVNLTNTADVDEMYAHASPDGTKLCFVADEGSGRNKVRSVYYMNIDGTGRVKVAHNARQACWGPDSKTIAYLKAEFERFTLRDYATKGLFFYDLQTQSHREHVNKKLHHLYNITWSADSNWFLATVHGGMGFGHAILAFRADQPEIYDLSKFEVGGCRPDFRFDDHMLTWGMTDWDLCTAHIDTASGQPIVSDVLCLVQCRKTHEIYHSDFSPDGKYIAFSHGLKASEIVGGKAPGWNICVCDLNGKWTEITTDGHHNKEPDWVPIAAAK